MAAVAAIKPAPPPFPLAPLAQAMHLPRATLVLRADPMPDAPPTAVLDIEPGCTIASLLPADLAQECIVCRYQGLWILRADWERPVAPGDIVEFHVRAMGGGLRSLLTIALIIAANVYAPGLGAALGFAGTTATAVGSALIMTAGSLALNAILPAAGAPAQQQQGISASPAYNVALSGNSARLDGAIPVLYGFNRTYPDFCTQSYQEFGANEDQFYYALLCLGLGQYDVHRIELDDTLLPSFQEVTYNVLQPGVGPSILTRRAVVTAPEVTGQELTSRYSGGFAACGPTLQATAIGVDVVLNGLGSANADGTFASKSITFSVDVRTIDDLGFPLTAWATIATNTITAATNSPIRRSFYHPLGGDRRVEVRLVRTDIKDDNYRVLNSPTWSGLRAYIAGSLPLDPNATHIEIKMRATEQLNGLSQRKISVASTRKVRTRTSAGAWTAPVATRNPAWALADKWTSTVYGDALPDSRCDLASLYALAQTWDARQDRLDIVFDTFTDSDAADQLMAGAGRAVVIRRNGVRTISRDQPADVPVCGFSARDIRPGSMSIKYSFADESTPDGLILEYFDNRAWDWLPINCPAPGITTMQRPIRRRLMGVTGRKHAEREGRFQAAKLVYRRRFPSWATEMQGVLPAYGSSVKFAPAIPGWCLSGDVVEWDAASRQMTLSEPPVFGVGAHYVSLRRDNGSLTAPIAVTAIADPYTVKLAAAPDFALVLDDPERERPTFLFGSAGQHEIRVLMLGIEPGGRDAEGAPLINCTGVVDKPAIHLVDNALLPAAGETQDPILTTPGVAPAPPPGAPPPTGVVQLSDHTITSSSSFGASFSLDNDGRAGLGFYPGEWLTSAPVSSSAAGAYAARASVISGAVGGGSDATGAWLALSTTRTWAVAPGGSVSLSIEIRSASDNVVQATRTISLSAS